MLTWQQFYEAQEAKATTEGLEEKEEELGKDLDGDGEKGESEEHKAKVLGWCKTCKMSKKKCKC